MSLAGGAAPKTEEEFHNLPPKKIQEHEDDVEGDDDNEGSNKNDGTKAEGKPKKRSFFGLGKKKDAGPKNISVTSTPALSKDTSKISSTSRTASSPLQTQADPIMFPPTTPNRVLESSPRLASPAGSQIFERDVQDSTVIQPNSPAIPQHIQTENHIPPVLDHASEAITNETLHPDSVEIITHASHQPASVTVTSAGLALTPREPALDDFGTDQLEPLDSKDPALSPDNASTYGSLDSSDIRRLSFISFADVVQAEHVGAGVGPGSRESVYMAGMNPLTATHANRSPSPIRSPISSQGPGTSPPTSNPGSMKGVDMSPPRKAMGSPKSIGQPSLAAPGGELNIETMSQALRRTGSTDMSSFRSAPTSPIDPPGSR